MQANLRALTETKLDKAISQDTPVLIEAPPASGKTWSAVRLAIASDHNVTYFSSRIDLYDEAEDIVKDSLITTERIPSPQRLCPTFRGENDGEAEKARRLYRKGISGRDIHYLGWDKVQMPCQDPREDGLCEYIRKLYRVSDPDRREQIDLLIGNHQHIYQDDWLKDRIVIVDEFNHSPFVTRFPSDDGRVTVRDDPAHLISTFLQATHEADDIDPLPFDDITDIIESRARQGDAYEAALDWFKTYGADNDTAQEINPPSPRTFDSADLRAPLLTLGLLLMEKTGPGMELAHAPDQWAMAGVDQNIRIARNRNTGVMLLLRPPSGLDKAEQVVALDALPTKRLWDTVFDVDFDHYQVIPREKIGQYLQDGFNLELVQLSDHANHYSGGNVSAKDDSRFKAVRAIEGVPFAVISRKKALEEYRRHPWFETCIAEYDGDKESTDTEKDYKALNYAKVLSSNEFKNESLGFVSGSPYPGDHVIKQWATLCGEGTEAEREDGTLTGFSGFGDDVYRHFTHHQVFQAILRFGRTEEAREEGATVYVNTTALPKWLDPTTKLTVKTNADKQAFVLAALRHVDQSDDKLSEQTIETLQDELQKYTDISKRHIRDSLVNEFQPVISLREDAGRNGTDLVKWSGSEYIHKYDETAVFCRIKDTIYVLPDIGMW